MASLVATAILTMSIQIASATSDPWQWVDVSDKLTVRRDRPVWAIARAEKYWYLTDGQDLRTGGHVWRTTGSNMSDVTKEVRNAGLNRVDDLVSDGQTVLLLSRVMAADASFEVVAQAGALTNLTLMLRQAVLPDEGLASVSGKDGVFLFVTTHGRILAWNSITQTISQLPDVPGATAYRGLYPGVLRYSVRKTSPYGSTFYLTAVPHSKGWLMVLRAPMGSQALSKVFRYENNTYSDITPLFSPSGLTRIYTLASNGQKVFMVASDVSTGAANRVYTYDGVEFSDLAALTSKLPSIDWARALVTHTGRSWMIVSGKDLVRFTGDRFEVLGQTLDYFVTLAGDANGKILLGGAVSNSNRPTEPTKPLTAKLVTVTDSAAHKLVTTPQTVVLGTSQSTFWTWLEPNAATLSRDQSLEYHVGAWNQNGLQRIEMFSNGNSAQICALGSRVLGNQTCTLVIQAKDYPPPADVSINAKITDANNLITWTPARTISIKLNPSAQVVAWTWLEPNLASLNWTDSAVVKAQAKAQEGLNRIEFYVNGSMRQRCDFARAYGLRDCELRLSGLDYAPGVSLQVAIKAVGHEGVAAWSQSRTIEVRDNKKDAGSRPSSITIGLSPNKNLLNADDSVIYMAQAQDADGLERIEILVDGKLAQVCGPFNNAYTARDCSLQIIPTQYPEHYSLNVTTRAIDSTGSITWSDTRNFALTHAKTI